jgi:hypothetical protein
LEDGPLFGFTKGAANSPAHGSGVVCGIGLVTGADREKLVEERVNSLFRIVSRRFGTGFILLSSRFIDGFSAVFGRSLHACTGARLCLALL